MANITFSAHEVNKAPVNQTTKSPPACAGGLFTLSILPEIGQTEMCRRVILPLFAQRGDYQHRYRYKIWQHLVELFHREVHSRGDI
mgnify:FL=1